jgi:hypothetical protein
MREPGTALIVWCAGIVTLVGMALLAEQASKAPVAVATIVLIAMILALVAL